MTIKQNQTVLSYLIAAVWIVNGFVCKVLNLVPRHEQIVSRILTTSYSRTITLMIGISEILMALWILTSIKSRWTAWCQILVVATMNVLEFVLVPDLLLWGRFNLLFAFLFIVVVYYNEFYLNKRIAQQS